MLVLTAAEMAELDAKTIREAGIPGIVLMENAAQGAAAFFLRAVPDLLKKPITVVAGGGNNAGDGFAMARIFHSRGAHVSVVCLRSPQKLGGDGLTNFSILEKIGIPVTIWDETKDFDAQWKAVSGSGAVIDAILGTGLKSGVKGLYREVIQRLNGLNVPVLSVDIPSGLDASTGLPLGAAVKAFATATFGFLKVGCVIERGPELTGRLEVIDIGIPPGLVASSGFSRWFLCEKMLSQWIEPRAPETHKGKAGHVCVLSGSVGKTGAAALVCLGAGRAGAGLVTLFVPESLNSILEVKLTEAMTLPIAETQQKTPSLAASDHILDFLRGKQALAMGPGISTNEDTAALVKKLLLSSPPALSCSMRTRLRRYPMTRPSFAKFRSRSSSPRTPARWPGFVTARFPISSATGSNPPRSSAKNTAWCWSSRATERSWPLPMENSPSTARGTPQWPQGEWGTLLQGLSPACLPRGSILFGRHAWASMSTGLPATGVLTGFPAAGFWRPTCSKRSLPFWGCSNVGKLYERIPLQLPMVKNVPCSWPKNWRTARGRVIFLRSGESWPPGKRFSPAGLPGGWASRPRKGDKPDLYHHK